MLFGPENRRREEHHFEVQTFLRSSTFATVVPTGSDRGGRWGEELTLARKALGHLLTERA